MFPCVGERTVAGWQLSVVGTQAAEIDHTLRHVVPGNCEAQALLIEHPLGITGFENGRFTGEHRRIKTDTGDEVVDREVNL